MRKAKLTALFLALCMLLSGGASTPPQRGWHRKISGSIEIGVMLAEGTSGYDFITGVGDQLITESPDLQITYTFVNTKARPFIEQRWRTTCSDIGCPSHG